MLSASLWRGQSVDQEEDTDERMEDADSVGDLSLWQECGQVLLLKVPDFCGDDSCLIDSFPGSPSRERSLRQRAARVLSQSVNKAIVTSGIQGLSPVLSYIGHLERRPLTLVITRVGELRPRFLPLEYHWAPTEKDPFLCLMEALPSVDAFVYVPHPLVSAQIECVLSLHSRLTALSLREGADDALLRLVGNICRTLSFLDVGGSKAVTDCGLRRLLLRPPAASRFHWRQLYRRWRELRSAIHSPGSTVSYHPIFASAPASPALEPAAQRTPVACTLKHLDLRGTKVSLVGAEWAAKRLEKGAHVVVQPPAPKGHRRLKSSSSEEGRQSLLGDSQP